MGAGRALVLAIGLATLTSGNALAHGTGARVLGTTATTVELYYVGGDPMAYAEAKVFSPEAPDVPFVNGRADKLGRIAFAANHDGVWRVEAHDAEGHRVQNRCHNRSGKRGGESWHQRPSVAALGQPDPQHSWSGWRGRVVAQPKGQTCSCAAPGGRMMICALI